MPELPEVEAVAQTVHPLVRGSKIRCVHVFHAIATKPQSPVDVVRSAQKQTIRAVARLGKYLLLELDRGILVIHFRLDGRLLWFGSARELLASADREPQNVHVDVALELNRGVLGFADRRHFGRVHFFESRKACNGIRSLGVDALAREFTPKHFQSLVSQSRRPLKEFLLDQTRVAGIGNIYSAESMWHARIDPRRPANSLSVKEAAKLHKAIVSVLRRALECCLHPAPDFSRSEMVVSRNRGNSSRVWSGRSAVPQMWPADSSNRTERTAHLFLQALSEVNVRNRKRQRNGRTA